MKALFEIDKYLQFGCIFFFMLLLVIVAILIDLWDGLYTAHRLKEPIISHITRKTGLKIMEYLRVVFLAGLIDAIGGFFPFWHLPYLSMLFTVLLVCVEAKSLFEHAKRRKSQIVKVNQVAQEIIKATTEEDALKAVRAVIELAHQTKHLNSHE